jgi:hypothetical protein
MPVIINLPKISGTVLQGLQMNQMKRKEKRKPHMLEKFTKMLPN